MHTVKRFQANFRADEKRNIPGQANPIFNFDSPRMQIAQALAAALACPTVPKCTALFVENALANHANPKAVLAVVEALKDGPRPSRDVEDYPRSVGILSSMLRRAYRQLSIVKVKRGKRWISALPESWEQKRRKPQPTAMRQWLASRLATGPAQQSVLATEAGQLGFKSYELTAAKNELGIESTKRGKVWYWSLPECRDQEVKTSGAPL